MFKRGLIDRGGYVERVAVQLLPTKSRRRITIRGGFWRKSAGSFAMTRLAIEGLADRSWMWCKARDRADNLRSHHA